MLFQGRGYSAKPIKDSPHSGNVKTNGPVCCIEELSEKYVEKFLGEAYTIICSIFPLERNVGHLHLNIYRGYTFFY